MKLILEGKINKIYVQSLCMAFFRGEKFPQDEENSRGTIIVKADEKENGIEAVCKLSYEGKETKKIAFVERDDSSSCERIAKIAIGRAVYFAGKEITGKDIPWGILTGIRPSKVGAELLLKYSYDEAFKVLVEKYLLSYDKAKLTLEVAKNELFQGFVQLVADTALTSGLNGGKNGEDVSAFTNGQAPVAPVAEEIKVEAPKADAPVQAKALNHALIFYSIP